jgi:hypothetical protein
MTTQEFEYQIRKLIYDTSAIQINQLIGTSKTSTASVGLYLNVPITVKARKISSLPEVDKSRHRLITSTTAYLKHDDASSIQFAFFYTSNKDLDALFRAAEKHSYYLTYVYMRELFRLMRNHNTKAYYDMVKRTITNKFPKIHPERYYNYLLIASDYSINNYLHQLYSQSSLSKYSEKIFEFENYSPSYNNMSDIDILLAVLANEPLSVHTYEIDSEPHDYTKSSKSSHWTGFADYDLKDNDTITVDLGESISNHLSSVSRGLGSAQIFQAAIQAVKVKTGWFKELQKSFTQTVYRLTAKHHASWSSYNIVYRHQFKAPKHVNEENLLNIYLSVDHSGSMSDTELGKLLYLITEQAENISTLTVWIHDTEIVKTYTLDSSDTLTVDDITQALGHREACGGTSHLCIAEELNRIQPDPETSIYISFSDNCSDIIQSWAKYPHLTDIPTYFVCTISNPVNISGTTDITIE